jgi:FAD dependent oxidoreductase
MRVAVLGGGFQGTGVALELSRRGVAVDLYDRNAVCITQAGLRNEGKIHLGFTYAKDQDLETAKIMARGGMAFGGIVQRWLEGDIASIGLSPPYDYAVHRGSLVPADRIERHFANVVALMRELAEGEGSLYLGEDVRKVWCRTVRSSDIYDEEITAAVFSTPERSIDVGRMAESLRQRIAADPRINFLPLMQVTEVVRLNGAWEVHCVHGGTPSCERYAQVVNCLWDGRLVIDQTAGLPPKPPWLYRLKFGLHFVLKQFDRPLPCTTIMLGPYGDTVRFDDGRCYLSWYPSCLTGMSPEIAPPHWPRELDGDAASEMIEATIAGLGETILPLRGLSQSDMDEVRLAGGIIFAAGETDIDDPNSQLHTRTKVGIRSKDGYHSVDPGKYTLVPMFAVEAADRVCGAA